MACSITMCLVAAIVCILCWNADFHGAAILVML